MQLHKTVTLKDGRTCILRNGTEEDGQALLDIFDLTHAQTDYLLTYPEESTLTARQEADYLKRKAESDDEIEILAELDGKIIGTAGIGCVDRKEKTRHRAEFGISVDRAYWGLGVGRALTEACVECAMTAGYVQLELQAVAENKAALALYRSFGFAEYGINPKGFRSRSASWQALVLMRLELGGKAAERGPTGGETVELRPITEDNFLEAFDLKLGAGQERFVSHPIRSLAQAYVYRNQCQPFGSFAKDRMIGYVMVVYDYDAREYNIWHMMIDESAQGHGRGSAALDRVIDYIRTKPFGDSDRIVLTCGRDNTFARRLYEKKGFRATGVGDEDETEFAMTVS